MMCELRVFENLLVCKLHYYNLYEYSLWRPFTRYTYRMKKLQRETNFLFANKNTRVPAPSLKLTQED